LGDKYDIDKLKEEKVGYIIRLELQTFGSIPLALLGTERGGLRSNSSFTYGRKRQTEEGNMACNKRSRYLYYPLTLG
jgi:hypothetical protein